MICTNIFLECEFFMNPIVDNTNVALIGPGSFADKLSGYYLSFMLRTRLEAWNISTHLYIACKFNYVGPNRNKSS